MNKEFKRYNTKIEIPASVVLETIFSTDNQDVETLSRLALKHGFVDLVEKENGKYYQLQDDYEKQSFYTYLSKKERKQYEYEDYLIKELEDKDKEIERLKRQIKIKDEWCDRIWEIGTDYDGYGNNLEELKKLVDELIEYSDKAKRCDDKSVAYISYENGKEIKENILMEELGSDKE